MISRFITSTDAAAFTGLLGLVMVLTGRELSGAIVIAASLGAFIFFEWYLFRRKPASESDEYRQMMQAAEQWEKAVAAREEEIERREATLNELKAKFRKEGEKRAPMFDGEVDIHCPPEYRDA